MLSQTKKLTCENCQNYSVLQLTFECPCLYSLIIIVFIFYVYICLLAVFKEFQVTCPCKPLPLGSKHGYDFLFTF